MGLIIFRIHFGLGLVLFWRTWHNDKLIYRCIWYHLSLGFPFLKKIGIPVNCCIEWLDFNLSFYLFFSTKYLKGQLVKDLSDSYQKQMQRTCSIKKKDIHLFYLT